MKKKFQLAHKTAKHTTRKVYKTITATILNYPARSFFGVIGVLFLLIIIGSFLGKPRGNGAAVEVTPKNVGIYGIGTAPRISVTARVEKSGVVKVIAQSSGIVAQVYVREGDEIARGTQIAWLSTNYQGGTLPSVTRQIAQKNYEFARDNYDAQKGMIDRQRAMAGDSHTQTADMRAITEDSMDNTESLINQNQEIVNALNAQIAYLESTNVGGANDAAIIQSKQGAAGAQAGINSLQVALATARYQTNTDNAPTQLSNNQYELTRAQLELQQKSLDLNRELAGLNLQVAGIAESLMYPVSPVTGTVERVYVTPGQNVSNGTVIAQITGDQTVSTIVALLPRETARNISRIEKSKIMAGGKTIEAYPRYISMEATDGALHTVLFAIDPDDEGLVTNGSSVAVELPIGSQGSTGAVPYVPLDALYQTQAESFVYVASKSATGAWMAASKVVTLGVVYGEYVEVTGGLSARDQVITTRNVVDGDTVTLK